MALDLNAAAVRDVAAQRLWADAARYWGVIDAVTRDLPAPVAVLGVDALARNAHDLIRRANGTPIRVATKSVRSREILETILAIDGYRGLMTYSLSESLWLANSFDDILLAYPTVDREALHELGRDPQMADRIVLTIDSEEHLDVIDAVLPPDKRHAIKISLDFDGSWRTGMLGHVGVRRSPLRTPHQLRVLAERVQARRGFELVGVMCYEAQIAGVANDPKRKRLVGLGLRAMQRRSAAELAERRAKAVAAVRAIADLRFVNGGGTGSLETTTAESSITEVAAGSGLYGPHLFDGYRHFEVAPALGFGLDVVRKSDPDRATLLGGGWIASGPPSADRSPLPVWPQGLEYEPREGAGEVQTPVRGPGAEQLRIGDRVWLRHTKAGEPLEHVREMVPVTAAGDLLEPVLSYRGEGKVFL